MVDELIIGKKYICPHCKKEFVANENHKYILRDGYTCSWECFKAGIEARKKATEETVEDNSTISKYTPLTEEQIEEVTAFYATHSGKQTAEHFGVSESDFWIIAEKNKIRKRK